MKSRGEPPPNGGTSFYKPVGGAHAPTKYDPGVNAVRLEGVPPPNGGTSFYKPVGAHTPRQNTTPALTP